MDSYPEGYVPCNCHPETCNHKDGMIFVGTSPKPKCEHPLHSRMKGGQCGVCGIFLSDKTPKKSKKSEDYKRGYKNGYKKGKKDGWKDGYHNAANFYYTPAH